MPAGLGWLRSVIRMGVTPVILLAVVVALVVMLWPSRPAVLRQPAEDDPAGTTPARISHPTEHRS
jgi:hypothetical protein